MGVLIEPTTQAVSSSKDTGFVLGQNRATLSADDLDGTEAVSVYYSSNGVKFTPAQNSEGNIKLTPTKHQVVLSGPGQYRVDKTVTTAPCGVFVSE